jgi:hypothetical protein
VSESGSGNCTRGIDRRKAVADETPARGFTTGDLARRLRVSEDKIRSWIRIGQLEAINVASTLSGKPRYVVTPEGLAGFEQSRRIAPPAKSKRKPRRTTEVDHFPD